MSLSFFLSTATMAWVLPHGAHLRLECSLENTTRKLYRLIAALHWKITKYVFTRLNILLFKVTCYSVFSSTFVVDLNYFFCYIFMLLLKSRYWMLISPLAVSWWLKQSALYWDSVPSSLVLSLHRLCAYVVCVILNASVITASMISMCIQENDGFHHQHALYSGIRMSQLMTCSVMWNMWIIQDSGNLFFFF